VKLDSSPIKSSRWWSSAVRKTE